MEDSSPFKYGDALNPRKYVICSIELKPYSLGHEILLDQLQMPLLKNGGQQVSMNDALYQFILSLLICGHSYEDNLIMLDDKKIIKSLIGDFQKNLSKSMRKENGWNIYDKITLFKDYIRFFSTPPTWQVNHKSKEAPSGIDWRQNLFTIARSEFGYSDSEVFNMPLKRLLYEYASYGEKNGSLKVWNSNEMKQLMESRARRMKK